MSARSSSGSWSGAGGSPADIIDLDKFMRGAVRPPRTDALSTRGGDKLVVDAGGVERAPALPAAPAPPMAPAPPRPIASDSSGSPPAPHGKRFSHDSGLSDTSYARRKHRPHRRALGGDSGGAGGACGAGGARARTPAGGSSASLRAFRAVCERALLDQQAQIARVAQLCERLSERPERSERLERPARRPSDRSGRSERSEHSASDTSDVSSSSRSTRDQRRKDKHRTDECKTYKIIMNKLDELNRLFAARARSPPPAAPARRPPVSSGSVSVSDKLVATEPESRGRPERLHAHTLAAFRGGSTYGACGSGAAGGAGCAGGSCGAGGAGCAGGAGGSARRPGTRAVTNTCALDVLPPHDSVLQCDSRAGTGTSGGDPRCGFDLDDPVHLYSQAKRLQAMSATTRRARSVDPHARRYPRYSHGERGEHSRERSSRAHSSSRGERAREPSLCALCRGYWRSLTHYIAAQIFRCPDAAVR